MKTLCGAVVVGVLALGLTTARGSAQQDAPTTAGAADPAELQAGDRRND